MENHPIISKYIFMLFGTQIADLGWFNIIECINRDVMICYELKNSEFLI